MAGCGSIRNIDREHHPDGSRNTDMRSPYLEKVPDISYKIPPKKPVADIFFHSYAIFDVLVMVVVKSRSAVIIIYRHHSAQISRHKDARDMNRWAAVDGN